VHHRDAIQNGYRRRLEEIPVLRANNIGFTDDRRLHCYSVIHIASRFEASDNTYLDDSTASRTGADALGHGVMTGEPPATRPWYAIR
jgi:hypothetical protein